MLTRKPIIAVAALSLALALAACGTSSSSSTTTAQPAADTVQTANACRTAMLADSGAAMQDLAAIRTDMQTVSSQISAGQDYTAALGQFAADLVPVERHMASWLADARRLGASPQLIAALTDYGTAFQTMRQGAETNNPTQLESGAASMTRANNEMPTVDSCGR
jgi:uncharacterized protein YPO0396